MISWRGLARIRQDLSDVESGMSQGGIENEWSSRSPVGCGGDKDRPTRNVSTLPLRFTANGHSRLAPSSTWRPEDTGAFNRWRSASSLFVLQRNVSSLCKYAGHPAGPRLSLCVCHADYRTTAFLTFLVRVYLVSSHLADIDAFRQSRYRN